MVDPSEIFIDGTYIKASANKKKFRKEQVKKTAKIYSDQLDEPLIFMIKIKGEANLPRKTP